MASTKQRISYVLPLDNDSAGHRLGVNGLAIDEEQSILYTGGRDGVLNTWNLNTSHIDPSATPKAGSPESKKSPISLRPSKHGPTHRQQVQAHTHWINDLLLVQGNCALVSASSDLSVKVWRPYAEHIVPPQIIGLHTDYIKRVAYPSSHSNRVITGGLDRKVFVWDLNGGGQTMQIEVASQDALTKGSIYSLAANESLIATGGPESVVKLWDARTGLSIVNFTGHTDVVRDILISQDSDKLMTASSDNTIKIWSLTARRCIQTLGMHTDSVWCLKSDHPQLSVFHSGDRSGFVAKTDLRGSQGMDDGLSVAICQEQEGVTRIATQKNRIWIATANSSLNCWQDADLSLGVGLPESVRSQRINHGVVKPRSPETSPPPPSDASAIEDGKKQLPFNCLLRISSTPGYLFGRSPSGGRYSIVSPPTARKNSMAMLTSEAGGFAPFRSLPLETIEGQDGLIKHIVLNDKQRVLTLDTTGNVTLWHLLKCKPIESFGKCSMDELASKLNSPNVTASWCTVDTRTGTVTCTIEEKHGFDAEIYADESEYANDMEFRDDLRFNLARWILRYLFSAFLEEEIRRDVQIRNNAMANSVRAQMGNFRQKPQLNIKLPPPTSSPWSPNLSAATPRAQASRYPMTPGLVIGLATPGIGALSPTLTATTSSAQGTDTDDGSRASAEGTDSDYFSQTPLESHVTAGLAMNDPGEDPKLPKTPSDNVDDKNILSPTETVKTPSGSSARFGKRFLTSLNKSGKRLVSRSDKPDDAKLAADAVGKAEDLSDANPAGAEEKMMPDPTTYREALQQMQTSYTSAADKATTDDQIETLIIPSPPTELPILHPPPGTTVIIQEDRSDAAGVADLFEGKVENLGLQAHLIEAVAPVWLADVLLYSRVPSKDVKDVNASKLTFVLEPYQDLLPYVCRTDGSERLTANRMLRARKMALYIADKLEPPEVGAEPDPDAIKPEEYIDLICNDQLVPPKANLAWIRAHIWKQNSDVLILYKANGRKQIEPRGIELYWPNGRPVTIPGQNTQSVGNGLTVDGAPGSRSAQVAS